MNRLVVAAALAISTLAWAVGDSRDVAGGKDPSLFTRMKGFHIANYEERAFDRYEFPVASGRSETVEGRHIYVDYYLNEGAVAPSALQITRNYTAAIKGIGGTVVHEYEDGGSQHATLKVARSDAETWAFVEGAGNGIYKLHVIERQLMRQEVTANAEAMASGLSSSGHIALYGVYFDTDKAQLKSESEPALAEIAKLLKANGAVRLYVVGHTDNQGSFDHNVRLSQARATEVVSALARKGIAADRLKPFGAGPAAPVASNNTDTGRARNRRVELVAQ